MAEAMYQAPGCGCRRGRRDRRLNGGGNVSGAMMWLHVGETEDSMVDAMYREPGCGWR